MSAQSQMLFQEPTMTYNNENTNEYQFIAHPNKTQRYPFLARPPPPQKARPDIPLPPPPAPAALSLPSCHLPLPSRVVAQTWAALVQPGSPAPRSPQRRPSTSSSRRPSLSRLHRRPSIAHARATDGSFINVTVDTAAPSPKSLPRTATPSAKNFDLTAFGYASVFVHLPKTPSTPSPFLRRDINQAVPPPPAPQVPVSASYSHIPIPPVPASPPPSKRTLNRFRSFGILRPRSKSTSTNMPSSPTKKSSSSATAKSRFFSPVDVTKRKKAKYNYVRPPPPLANDLAMLQFSEGGTLESHAQRVMEKQARQAAGTYTGADIGVGDVYRDGKGGIWWDVDEELEYQPLMAAQQTMADEEMQWVKFTSDSEEDKENEGIVDLAGVDERRGSTSTQDSDLDPKYLVEEQQPDDAILSRKVGMSVLSLPSRPRRAAKHLHKPEFLVDVAAFGPRSPRSFGFVPKSPISSSHKPKGKARRRPPPLKLASPASVHKKPVNSPVDADRMRKEFMENSFAPSPLSPAPQPQLLQIPEVPITPQLSSLRPGLASKVNLAALRSVDSLALAGKMVKKPSVFNIRGVFGKRIE
ncbi:hypothetical protein BDQ17DRAFT_1371615 [Cyathus striatus]|nr:hypothetical protein BDQ17DRAFT_1371615 [Cyathus striatus]